LSLIRRDRAISILGRSEVLTNSTASRLSSGGHVDGRLTQGSFLWRHARLRCPPKRVEVTDGVNRNEVRVQFADVDE
jgi:hypothetical protein